MTGSFTLERRYRLLLRAYPAAYRERHGDELIGTLMQASGPQATLPTAREALHLLSGGLTTRVREARSRAPWWADGLHLGVLAVATTTFATRLDLTPHLVRPVWTLLAILLMLAIVRGRVALALPLALIAALEATGVLGAMGVPDFGSSPVEVSNRVPYLVIVAGLGVLAVRGRRRLPARSWIWLLVPVFAWAVRAAALSLGFHSFTEETAWLLFRAGVEVLLLGAVVWATSVARDARWALAGALYLIPGLAYFAENLSEHGRKGLAYWGLLTVLVAASLVVARRRRERI